MSERSIASYFKGSSQKRVLSSSSDSDNSCLSGTPDKQQKKRANICDSTPLESMALEAALEKITQRLDALATKDDIVTVRSEIRDLTNSFMKKVEHLEARVFEVEAYVDKHDKEVATIKKKNEELQNVMRHQDLRIK